MENFKMKLTRKTAPLLDKYLSGETIHFKEIIAIMIPIIVDQAFLVLMSFLNTAMVSSAGVAAVSAVSMIDSLNIFLVNVFIAVATGGTVIVAQYTGAGNMKMASKTAIQAISAVLLFSVLIGALVIIFHTQALQILFGKADEDVFHNAKLYLIGSCLSYPFMGIFQAVCGALRGIGDTKPTLKLSIILNLTNTALNVLFILILKMGVLGLVISILLSRIVGMAASLIYIIKYNETIHFQFKKALQIDFSIIKKIMYIGLPFAAEQMFFSGGKLLTQTFIVQLGTFALTSYAIGNSFLLLFQIGPNALTIAAITIVGQCIGHRNIADARKFTKSMAGLSSLLFIVSGAMIVPLYPLLIKIFSPPDEIAGTVFILVLISAFAQPILWPHSFIMPSALRAAGDSTFTSVASLLSMWLVRVVLGYILGITLGFGIIGIWTAMAIEWGVRGLIFSWRFKGKTWYTHKLV
ncbi:MATE family efflux transporter [Neobacillus niacini]|nr:MATE family efflux transporter [Neobacillus niacini]MCM3764153.1 MATE family efflux transporter [Neobacillus niacini]